MKRIGIFSPSGTSNLGDETTVAVLIENIKQRHPDAEIYAVTSVPVDTRQRHGIEAYPLRNISHASSPNGTADFRRTANASGFGGTVKAVLKKITLIRGAVRFIQRVWGMCGSAAGELVFLSASYKRIRGTDLFIVGGSGVLCDNFYGVWNFPYTLLKWTIMAKVAGSKLAFLSCGAGPIHSRVSRILFRRALSLADYRSFRDRESKELIRNTGLKTDDLVVPDLVFGLNVHGDGQPERGVIALNPFPYYDHRYWPESSSDTYQKYLNMLASFASWLMKKGYTVLLFPTQLRADPLVIQDLKAILMKDGSLNLEQQLLAEPVKNLDDLIAQISMSDVVIASRFHGVLISFLLEKPVIALSHHPKVDSLMRDMGQTDYLLKIDTLDSQTLENRFLALQSGNSVVRRQITSKLTGNRLALKTQYDELFGASFGMASETELAPTRAV